MSVDVPFETAEQISAKLALFEELFQYRYSERDEGYRQCLQNASRCVHEGFGIYLLNILHVEQCACIVESRCPTCVILCGSVSGALA